jgi:hypothetical protein
MIKKLTRSRMSFLHTCRWRDGDFISHSVIGRIETAKAQFGCEIIHVNDAFPASCGERVKEGGGPLVVQVAEVQSLMAATACEVFRGTMKDRLRQMEPAAAPQMLEAVRQFLVERSKPKN